MKFFESLYSMPTKQRSPFTVFARDFFQSNNYKYTSCVDTALNMMAVWKEMPDEERNMYVEKCNKDLEEANELDGCDDGNLVNDTNTIKKLRKYVKIRDIQRWECSGYLFFVNELFDICGDINVSPEENVRMFIKMWNSLDEDVQGRYRSNALEMWMKKSRKKKRSTKDSRPQRDSNPQPSAP
ncbi:uncharacterized protein Eint_061210 [Encephalitozoon intestinalis ATCC 50506]|uniref:HMG box domain-containing protein n=1 Tax=Encephalitozoon intestinalis (strain ATCC 50506) TaxID=876142 RepID=E0S7P8_ENCIT|nr:uncharacterized protein Eint_061210 [Encephalitozoon intestinalis ATCC 50506]ADM11727.2 hypothetical protein Eint_061210 [Encephalitozoon intestinalis ATCC 50506]UTX45466.1 hypothetical protein GPK93_06g10210 [Encephalitozoon intestinalis]